MDGSVSQTLLYYTTKSYEKIIINRKIKPTSHFDIILRTILFPQILITINEIKVITHLQRRRHCPGRPGSVCNWQCSLHQRSLWRYPHWPEAFRTDLVLRIVEKSQNYIFFVSKWTMQLNKKANICVHFNSNSTEKQTTQFFCNRYKIGQVKSNSSRDLWHEVCPTTGSIINGVQLLQ